MCEKHNYRPTSQIFALVFSFDKIRFSNMPVVADKPTPLNTKSPPRSTAPPTPIVSIILEITKLRVSSKFTLLRIMLCIPTEAIVPKSNNIIPPSTACGILCKSTFSLPMTENTIAVMRITCGSVIFVICYAPVTSLYVVTGGPLINAPIKHANPSPSNVL